MGYETIKSILHSKDDDFRYHVFLGSRSLAKAEEAIKALRSDSQSSIVIDPVEIDITSDKSINDAVESIKQKTNHLDVLVNNAGECLL